MNGIDEILSAPASFRILVVEDDDGLCNLIIKTLCKAGFETEGTSTAEGALERIAADPTLVLLIDQCLPDMTGSSLVNTLRERGTDPSFVVMTGQGDERLAVEMMKLGAFDYLIKDTELCQRLPLVCAALFRQIETQARLETTVQALSASEQRYQSITEQLTEMLFVHDLKGIILEVNRAASVGVGYSRQELLGMSIFHLHTNHESKHKRENIQQQWKTWPVGNRVSLEWNLRRKDNSIFPVEYTAGKMFLGGNEVVIAVVKDISDRKIAEEKIVRHVEELQRWYKITLDREERILQLKAEVNQLLCETGKSPRYSVVLEEKHE